jgi:hypothetical protein
VSLDDAVSRTIKTWPQYQGGDPNLTDISFLADAIRTVCNLTLEDTYLTKEQVISIVELVERELLSKPSIRPLWTDILAVRSKDQHQLIEELAKIGKEILLAHPTFGSIESAVMKSLYMWHGCLNIDKACRRVTAQGQQIDNDHRLALHIRLLRQSQTNVWIKKGFMSASNFRQHEKDKKEYSWIPSESPYWQKL